MFDVTPFIQVAEQLLCADETILALNVLKGMPGIYRDFPPKEVIDLKREIMSRMATSAFYATHVGTELNVQDDHCMNMQHSLRGILISKDVKVLNENGIIPHVMDIGIGEGWLPFIMGQNGLEFTYEPIYVNHPTYEGVKRRFEHFLDKKKPEQPVIYVACEIIEHLWNEEEIRYEMQQRHGLADIIHVSTPRYTFDTNCTDWRVKDWLGHIRTYTPKEFANLLSDMFQEYEPCFYDAHIQHARMINKETKFNCIKIHYQLDMVKPNEN